GGVLEIGFVGRLSTEKNVRVLASLERELVAGGLANFRIVVIGHGSERVWLENRMSHARFMGVLTGESLATAVANFDLFAFPSRSETFGLALLEAMSCGVPVVAMGYGGPAFMVRHGITGLLAESDDEFIT